MDLGVIAQNWKFLIVQGLLGIGNFAGGTLRLAIPAIALGFLLGIFIGLARLAPSRWLRGAATAYVEFFRGVPLVMVIFWMWFVIPQPAPAHSRYGVALCLRDLRGRVLRRDRAGRRAVGAPGQVEAARALGLSGAQSMRLVVLPQALRNMVPALVTQMIVLFKDTSLASIIGYVDLTKAAQIVNNREIKPFQLYLFIAVVYWLCAYSMSRVARRLEQGRV
jgi:His/Glu/Gln/Arg/opine family amino acid ABC transporter permease subunit